MSIGVIFDVLGGILLESLFNSVLKHMLESLHRSGLEVIVICHAVLYADFVANQATHLSLPSRVQRAIYHAVLSRLKHVLVAIKDLLIIHDFRFGAWSHQDNFADVIFEKLLLPVRQAVKHLSGALVIANICQLLLFCFFLNLHDESWQVELGHLRVGPVPDISLIHLRLSARLQLAIIAASVVTEPNIVTRIEELKRDGFTNFLLFEPNE